MRVKFELRGFIVALSECGENLGKSGGLIILTSLGTPANIRYSNRC